MRRRKMRARSAQRARLGRLPFHGHTAKLLARVSILATGVDFGAIGTSA